MYIHAIRTQHIIALHGTYLAEATPNAPDVLVAGHRHEQLPGLDCSSCR
jgi:hypothetical protein